MGNIGHKLAEIQNGNISFSSNKSIEIENKKKVIPDQSCSIHDSFLNNNFDFFYNYIYGPVEENNCPEIFKHLNSCYSCFRIFSQTMREYIHKKNEITLNANGVAK